MGLKPKVCGNVLKAIQPVGDLMMRQPPRTKAEGYVCVVRNEVQRPGEIC